jgi:hypothetical protein
VTGPVQTVEARAVKVIIPAAIPTLNSRQATLKSLFVCDIERKRIFGGICSFDFPKFWNRPRPKLSYFEKGGFDNAFSPRRSNPIF